MVQAAQAVVVVLRKDRIVGSIMNHLQDHRAAPRPAVGQAGQVGCHPPQQGQTCRTCLPVRQEGKSVECMVIRKVLHLEHPVACQYQVSAVMLRQGRVVGPMDHLQVPL